MSDQPNNTGGRDGASRESAIIVKSVAEEYQWLRQHHPDFRLLRQSLDIGGTPCDVLTCQNERGEQKVFFFDISGFFGKG